MAGRGRDLTKPAWLVAQEQGIDPMAAIRMPGINAGGSGMELALAGSSGPAQESESDESSSDDDDDLPPGPIDPDKCLASGPGFAGGAAGTQLSFKLISKDSRGKRITEGGNYVTAYLLPGSSARAAGAETVQAEVVDNRDGIFIARYTVPVRGDWELNVAINGTPIGGSPFPVFFSPPETASDQAAAALEEPSGPTDIATSLAAAMPNVKALESQLMASLPPMLPPSVLGAAAATAKVTFPDDEGMLLKTVLVGNLSPLVNAEKLSQLFSFVGTVKEMAFVGDAKQFALVQFESEKEANSAISMNNMNFLERQIKVEAAKVAKSAAQEGGSNPFAALHMQQLVQIQMSQLHSQTLAAQVAAMRAQAKTSGAPIVAGLAPNSASQKAAALTAIAALTKKLGGGGRGPEHEKSPISRGRGRRPVSPTIRYRDRRSRSRSRSRSKRAGSRGDSRERRRGRARSDSRERARARERERREREKEREREREREKARERERMRARERREEAERRERDRRRERERDNRHRERSVERNRSRQRDRERDTDRPSAKREDDVRARSTSTAPGKRSASHGEKGREASQPADQGPDNGEAGPLTVPVPDQGMSPKGASENGAKETSPKPEKAEGAPREREREKAQEDGARSGDRRYWDRDREDDRGRDRRASNGYGGRDRPRGYERDRERGRDRTYRDEWRDARDHERRRGPRTPSPSPDPTARADKGTPPSHKAVEESLREKALEAMKGSRGAPFHGSPSDGDSPLPLPPPPRRDQSPSDGNPPRLLPPPPARHNSREGGDHKDDDGERPRPTEPSAAAGNGVVRGEDVDLADEEHGHRRASEGMEGDANGEERASGSPDRARKAKKHKHKKHRGKEKERAHKRGRRERSEDNELDSPMRSKSQRRARSVSQE